MYRVEIAEEWLYHMGVPEELIHEFASEGCNTVPCYMPYITSYFMALVKMATVHFVVPKWL